MILQNWWYTTLLNTDVHFCPPLKDNISCEVLVVGGGMAGLHAALDLARAGRSVVLLERNICGGSSTGKSAGFLTPDSELELSQLVRRFGLDGARRLWDFASGGVKRIVASIHDYNLSCDFMKQDSLFLGIGFSGQKAVQEEARARSQLEFPVTYYDRERLQTVNRGRGYQAGVYYDDTYAINPLLYAQELKGALEELGVRVFESTEVMAFDDHIAKTHLGSVKAECIIFAIDKMRPSVSPVADQTYHAQTFLCVSDPLEDNDIEYIFPKPAMCWDSRLVYSYYRLTGDRRLLLGGGTALTTFLPMDVTQPFVINGVIKDFKRRFPDLDHLDMIQYWPGRIDTTKDLIPIVDSDPRYPYVHYVIGCVGLPWAAACGAYGASHLLEAKTSDDYHDYFSINRPYLIGATAQSLAGKMVSFSLNNAYSKYWQRDKR